MQQLVLEGASIHSLFVHPKIDSVDLRVLLCYALGRTHAQLIAHSDDVLTKEETNVISQLIYRRLKGEPIAYIVGEREFYGLNFKVTPDVLIPRPETEHLVELVIAALPNQGAFLDLGTGSGAIAISVASQRTDCQVSATDISHRALLVAKENAMRLLNHPIQFYEGHWFQAISNHQTFDVIASNPPYIAKEDPHLEKGDLRFEPSLALTDQADGLTAYRELIALAPRYLKKGGTLLLEHGYDQAQKIQELLSQFGFTEIKTHADYAGLNRVSVGRFL